MHFKIETGQRSAATKHGKAIALYVNTIIGSSRSDRRRRRESYYYYYLHHVPTIIYYCGSFLHVQATTNGCLDYLMSLRTGETVAFTSLQDNATGLEFINFFEPPTHVERVKWALRELLLGFT